MLLLSYLFQKKKRRLQSSLSIYGEECFGPPKRIKESEERKLDGREDS
jgi:hypothetical protein